jgi:hypothetical protein
MGQARRWRDAAGALPDDPTRWGPHEARFPTRHTPQGEKGVRLSLVHPLFHAKFDRH